MVTQSGSSPDTHLPEQKVWRKRSKAQRMILYIQGISEAVARILSHLDVKVHMKPKYTLMSILSRPNNEILDADKSKVIYKISCRDCDASYVSETSRALKTHLSKH